MNEPDLSPHPRPPSPLRSFVERHGAKLLALAAFAQALWYMVAQFDFSFEIGDSGVTLGDPWRIWLGQVPHRDFLQVYPPGSFLPTLVAYLVFGVNLFAGRITTFLWGLGLLLGADALLRKLAAATWTRAALAALLTEFGVYYWPLPSHHWAVDVSQLFAALALLHALDGKRPIALGFLGGVLTGYAGFCLQDQGAYFAILLPLTSLVWIRDRSLRLRVSLAWATGMALVAAAFLVWLLPRVSIREILFQLLTFPATRYKNINSPEGLFPGWHWYWGPIVMRRPILMMGLDLTEIALGLAPIVGLGTAVVAVRRKWAPGPQVGVMVALALAHLYLHRWSQVNLVFAAAPVFVLSCWAMERGLASTKRVWRALAVAGMVLAVVGSSFAVVGTLIASAPSRTHSFQTRVGRVRSLLELDDMEQVVAAIERLVPEGRPMFCAGFMPYYNFLTQRPLATRYSMFVNPSYNTAEQAAEVIATLDAHPEYWVLLRLPADDSDLAFYWSTQYRIAYRRGNLVLLERKKAK